MSGELNEYLKQTQRFLRDARMETNNPGDLISYVNRARREVAMRSQAIRVLTPISGQIVSWEVTAGGAGYSDTPVLTVSAPDFPSGRPPYPLGLQATATAIVQGGVITAIDSQIGGSGYYLPTIEITDTTGSGATATPTMSFINQLNEGQELYNFSDIDVSMFPGVGAVYAIHSVSIIYANYRYSLPCYSFSTYQAFIRQYPYQYSYVPTFCAQFGQGTSGSFYMYPLPSQAYQLEFDCFALPQDLIDNNSEEALPMPWTEAVPFYAAHLAYLELQNFNYAKGYLDLYEKFALRYSQYARPGRVVNPYGRY